MKNVNEIPTEELFKLAKAPAANGFSIYEFLLETCSEVKMIFDKVAQSGGNFALFERFCDSVMTRENAITFLYESGHFRV